MLPTHTVLRVFYLHTVDSHYLLVICEFSYSLKFICNPNINSWSLENMCRTLKNIVTCCAHSQLRANVAILCLLASVLILFFYSLFVPRFFSWLGFLLAIAVFNVAPKCSAGVLSSVPKCTKAVNHLREKIQVLDKFHLGAGYSATGCELNINESTIYIKVSFNRNTHKTRRCIAWLMKM